MKLKIKDFAALTGVSARTLHYYDEIGLLRPSEVDEETGYRFYNEKSLLRMQEILFYRELDFSLKSISEILSSPDYDKTKALDEQKKLLMLKKERLERLISAIDSAKKGTNIMTAFDNSTYEKYKSEVKEKWGNTDAYKEYSEKSKGYTKNDFNRATDGMNLLFAEFALTMKNGNEPDSKEAQQLVKKLQDFISNNFYTCTTEILAGLGQMYVLDERFRENIDKSAEGTAEFVSEAIKTYIEK